MATPIPPNRAPLDAWTAAAATGGTIARVTDVVATGITSDSRAVTRGSAFVALRGESHDGHVFVADAVAKGASLVIVDRAYASHAAHAGSLPAVDAVVVDDTLAAWGALAHAHLMAWRRAHLRARVVAITGSAGKTTTKELCAALLAPAGPSLRTPGNLNNRVGLPAVVFGLESAHAFAVLEMGMSLPGEIAALASIAPPDVAVIVNAGIAHAEGVGGTRADVAREKGAIYAALAPEGVAVVNLDDPAAAAQIARSPARHHATFGRHARARYRLVDRAAREDGARVVVSRDGERLAIDLPIVGEAAAIDFVAALAAAEAAAGRSYSAPQIQEALRDLANAEGRATIRRLADGTIVLDDTYNANPASVLAAIGTLGELARSASGLRRTVAILGEMKELGPRAHAEHEAIGAALEEAGVSLVIGCGGLADVIVDRVTPRLGAIRANDSNEAAALACAHVRPGDAVLVKGSRSVRAEAVVTALVQSRGLAGAKGQR